MGEIMIIKSVMALLLTASLAGGAVYYGGQPVGENGVKSTPATAAQTPPEKQDDEKYIDRFVKSGDEPAPDEAQGDGAASERDRLLDLEADLPETPPTSSDVEMDADIIASSPAAGGTKGLPRQETVRVTKVVTTTAMETSSSDEIIEMVLAQTEIIGTQELKDQAYLDLVDYAVRHQDYETALTVMANIKQTELRDTARARIAIAIAKGGEGARAFAIIDTVEIDQLRDVMRLQVIEALIMPAQTKQ